MEIAVESMLMNQDELAVLPTAYGKSLISLSLRSDEAEMEKLQRSR